MDVATPLEQRYSQQSTPQQSQPADQEQEPHSTTLRHQPLDSVTSQHPPSPSAVSTGHTPHTSSEKPKLLYQYISNVPTNGVAPHTPSNNVSTPSEPAGVVPAAKNADPNQVSSPQSQQPPPTPAPQSANIKSPSHVNGTKSAIPRLRPSGIPRLNNFALPSSASLELSSAGSNNNNNARVRANGHRASNTPSPPEAAGPIQAKNQPDSTPITPLSARPLVGYNQQASTYGLSRPQLGHMDLANHDPGRGQQYSARSRACVRSAVSGSGRGDRAISEHPHRPGDTESDTSSVFSSSGTPRVISSKINSLKNVHHKPGGGNVAIVNEKVQLGPIKSKCNSLANVKHKPGGGNVKIVDDKLDLSSAHSRINSLQNAKHVPAGGNVQIYNETLPWLKYNKPNLPPEEKARINKQHSGSQSGAGGMNSSMHSGSTRS